MQNQDKYNKQWLEDRAINSINPIAPHTWDYSDSLLLYIDSGVEKYESIQSTDTTYFKLVTKPEREYLLSIAKSVVDLLPSHFEYIDLGPGTEHKEQFFFDQLKEQGKTFTYIPVDISKYYLELAEKHALNQGIPTHPLRASFEELPELLGEAKVPRFVNIGLTFSNYHPQVILDLLKKIAGKNSYFFINSQMRDRVDMVALHKVYGEDQRTMTDDKLKLVGLNPETDIAQRDSDSELRVWCEIVNPSEKLKEKGVVAGDKILVFQSLRYLPEQLEEEIKKVSKFYELFDTGSSFIAGLIKV
ncbi:MAG: L-histidine N(alpha)-methyltransferase [Candidatus Pacebacteria bacterium]|nr:L-histidine N(alpha)-methyltransferase [Candidatus Paceibacterota bacterium]